VPPYPPTPRDVVRSIGGFKRGAKGAMALRTWTPTSSRRGHLVPTMQENLLAAGALPRTPLREPPPDPLAGGKGAGCPQNSIPVGPRPWPEIKDLAPPNMRGWIRLYPPPYPQPLYPYPSPKPATVTKQSHESHLHKVCVTKKLSYATPTFILFFFRFADPHQCTSPIPCFTARFTY